VNKKPYFFKVPAQKRPLWTGEKPLLSWLDIELTERCNNNCIHCYNNLPAYDRNAKEKEMSTDYLKGVLIEAASLGCLTVRFTGGEPLLRKDFEEIYIFTRKLGIKVALFTNATLITSDLAKLFSEIPLLEPIEVTAYGIDKKSYEKITRIPGSFEAFQEGINNLLERKIPFVVKGVAFPFNKKKVNIFDAWAASLPDMNKPPSMVVSLDLRARRDSFEKNEKIRSLRLSSEEVLSVLTRDPDLYQKNMSNFCHKYMGAGGDSLFNCGAGIRSASLDSYGKLQLCLILRHPETVYNLDKGSLHDALLNFFPSVRNKKAKNQEYLNRCARCFLGGLCESCPAKSWMEYGTLDTPVEFHCKAAHAQGRYLGILNEGEKAWEVKDWQKRIHQIKSDLLKDNIARVVLGKEKMNSNQKGG